MAKMLVNITGERVFIDGSKKVTEIISKTIPVGEFESLAHEDIVLCYEIKIKATSPCGAIKPYHRKGGVIYEE